MLTHHSRLQFFGAVLVLDPDCRQMQVALGENLTLAISAYEISTLNMHLEQERKALALANHRLEQLAHFDPLIQAWNRYRVEIAEQRTG
ncbi:hypothetical protein [Halomonas sp. 18071143]|uniref:hypothetical protein n=1 Tax=unclassified Halomonas TaxID=2609666 RepID=UPI0009C08123|nr:MULTISPECIES: hypothetical protein [unclassified Halomonas]